MVLTNLLWQAPPQDPIVDILDSEHKGHRAEREVISRVDAVPHGGSRHDGERAGELPFGGEGLVDVDDEPVLHRHVPRPERLAERRDGLHAVLVDVVHRLKVVALRGVGFLIVAETRREG